MTTSARSMARRAGDNPVVEAGARLGYAASGLLHLVLAWLTLQLVVGSGGGSADQSGALAQLAGTALGTALLWALLAGFVLLGVWQVTEAVARRGSDRVRPAAKAVVYAALAFSTVSVLRGASSSSDQQAQSATARLMSQPAGVWLVGVTGAVIVGVGVFHVVKGARATFLRDLREHPHRWVIRIARVGYVTKGIALGAVGVLFAVAAVNHDPDKAGGLDDALHSLLGVPAGAVLVAAIAVGFACYGLYSFARAAYARV
ncbi:DUF1206 domain-containing protein [Actinotalea sp. M2MS4P-6]|uniref:DUF1206 domain-containing protein n=1 Tax=Actinotalea sp. M2MS4P-6 TaxID=2983762 RepID=UPI0021E506B6|nr:DUF1206 domain-containing protein [Actinotalea sp. M2MS4P-6]MCV2396057.1 DUF1206 domain-containing protein [Actinotalea sp. M2MS4P-6]